MKLYRPLLAVVLAVILLSTGIYSAVSLNTGEIRYDANGGTGAPAAASSMKGSEFTVSDDIPSMKGFRFSGWSLDRFADTGDIQPGSKIKFDSDTILYAIWKPYGDLVILTDPGLDDAIAMCELFRNIDLFDSVTLVAVGGNTDNMGCLDNIRKVVELKGVEEKVTIVSTSGIEQNHGDSSMIHGKDYLGDLYSFTPTVGYTEYEDWIKDVKHIDWLVSLGGCTVTKKILDTVDVGNLLLMAGFVHSDPFYGKLEFNQMMDHEAFSYCVKRDHRIVTIDTGSDGGPLDVIDLKVDGIDPEDKFFIAFQKNCIDAKDAAIAVWDHIAITYLLHPHYFTFLTETDMYGDDLNNLKYVNPVYNPSLHIVE